MLFPHFLSSPTSGFTTPENGSTILLRESSFQVYAQIEFFFSVAVLSVYSGRHARKAVSLLFHSYCMLENNVFSFENVSVE